MTSKGLRPITLCALLVLAQASPAAIYRWVDEQGNVRFSDSVPPKVSKLERHVLDKQGNLRDVLKRQRTVEELELHRRRLDAMETEQSRREEQEKYDQFLWTTFPSLEAIEQLRDERLSERDSQIQAAEQELADLRHAMEREGKRKVSSAVAQQNLLRSLQNDVEALESKVKEMNALRQKEFDGLNRDMQRYEYLRVQKAINQGG